MAKRKIFRRRRNGEGSVVQRKEGRFQASRMFHGKRIYFYSWDEAECYHWLDELKVKEMQGMPITDSNATLEEYTCNYIERYCKPYVRPATLKNYQGYNENYIAASNIGKMKLCRIYADHIQDFVNELVEKGLSGKTIANIMSFLEAVFSQAVRSRLIFYNPCEGIRLPKKKTRERPLITEEEFERLLESADTQTMRTAIAVLGEGLRIGELLALQWKDLKEVEGVKILSISKGLKREYLFDDAAEKKNGSKTEVKVSDTKTDSSVRQVPVTQSVLAALDALKSEQQLIAQELGIQFMDEYFIVSSVIDIGFTYTTPDKFRADFAKCVKKAGLPKEVTPHALRKYTSSTLIRKGASPVAVAKLLGHSNCSTTLNYYSRENIKGTFEAVKLLENDIQAV